MSDMKANAGWRSPLATALGLALLAMGSNAHAAAVDCSDAAPWSAAQVYAVPTDVTYLDILYRNQWWTTNENPAQTGQWGVWQTLGECGSGSNLPPVTAIVSPQNDSAVLVGDEVTIMASASDPDAGDTLVKLELWVNDLLVATDSSAPFSFNWQAASAGVYLLQTKAYDSHEASGVSQPIKLTANIGNQAPRVSLTAPADNFVLTLNTPLALTAEASDPEGELAGVRFWVNGELIGEDASAPYSASYTAPSAGPLRLQAEAVDSQGASSLSTALTGFAGTQTGDDEACRPEGLLGNSRYCLVYDESGREKMGADHARRIIGYFTSWRTGKNHQAAYLAKDIPWDKITHINYAFAHIDASNHISVGDPASPDNAATGMTWDGVAGAEMDPTYAYKGHFNLLNKYKKLHPNVKTLISIGGWAETGGYFDDTGARVASGGFYEMTKTQQGMDTFADSVVAFLRTYGFDGADIDYEYATSMAKSGNPDDFAVSEPLRASLFKQYDALMQTLRERLDAAGLADGRHYMLTVAAPASGYLLRGMEAYQMTRYLDYVNIMSYDLHGAWNDFVGHNAALFDTGSDAELAFWDVYSTVQYGGIGYLNTDWAYHYFRGAMPAGRINIGIPYYTRGWQNVSGGTNGLWGLAAYPDQTACPTGTGDGTANCGYGAQGIDNLWHDLDIHGAEMFAGSNPMWHAKNLEQGISGSYLADYGLDPSLPSDRLTGTYERHYDAVAESSWLWNPLKKVFLSTEDEQAMGRKVQYVLDKGIGGVMFWELAGDFAWYPSRNAGQGEFYIGDTMTSIAYNAFATATPYGNRLSNQPRPQQALDLSASLSGFKQGDSNYPITPTLTISNHSHVTIPGGAEIAFDIATATSAVISDESGMGLTVVADGSNAAGNNIGGLEKDFHRVKFTLPSWKSLAPGASFAGSIKYYLPVAMPSNFSVSFNGETYGFGSEGAGPQLPSADCDTEPAACPPPEDGCAAAGIDASLIPAYPDFPQKDWQGNPSHAATGDRMKNASAVFEALWWTQDSPGSSGSWRFLCNLP
ncbi:glycoside hydrolase [Shewanella sp. SHSM-M6]|uniref:Glycoside hydrolase n=2 Tax=Shewanella salipaludis TaxID=2723052 RepID=A0A972FQF0_9GAMM|nr:glycoside hydrolase [Shewanella salipaludis]